MATLTIRGPKSDYPKEKIIIPYGQTHCIDDEFYTKAADLAAQFILLARKQPGGIRADHFDHCADEMLNNPDTAAWFLTLLNNKFSAMLLKESNHWFIYPVGRPTPKELYRMLMSGRVYESVGWNCAQSQDGHFVYPKFWYNITELNHVYNYILEQQATIDQVSHRVTTRVFHDENIFIVHLTSQSYSVVRIAYHSDGLIIDISVRQRYSGG